MLLFASGVVVLYAQPPNPVLSTAGTVAVFAFVAFCWWGLALLNTQDHAGRHLFAVTAGQRTYVVGRLVALIALVAVASLLAVAFPTVTGRFERQPTAVELVLCLLGTFVCGLTGAALAALFSQPMVRSRAIAVLGLTACAVFAVPLGISPAIATARAMDVETAADAASRLLPTLASIGAFAVLAAVVCMLLWERRE
jgi:hypothetical protein